MAANWVPPYGAGTVSSVAVAAPTGISVSGSPVTATGTISLSLDVSGLLKGSGGAIVAATSGVDYAPASHTHAAYNPGGSSGAVQYNNAGAFGGFGSWDGTILGLASGTYHRVGTGTAVAQEIMRAGDYRFIHTTGAITNCFVGILAGTTSVSGTYNAAFGTSAMRASTTSANSTCIGADAGRLGASIQSCTFLGNAAGYSAGSSGGVASQAVLIGASAAGNATTVNRVVVIGGSNLTAATSITDILVAGQYCARSVANPTGSTVIGNYAFNTATSLASSVGIGLNAGAYATSSAENVFIGSNAGAAITGAGAGCTFVGSQAGGASPTPTAPSYAGGLGFQSYPGGNNMFSIGGNIALSAVAIQIGPRATVADADVPTGCLAMWFDNTIGATKVKFKGKDSGGTVRTGEIALS